MNIFDVEGSFLDYSPGALRKMVESGGNSASVLTSPIRDQPFQNMPMLHDFESWAVQHHAAEYVPTKRIFPDAYDRATAEEIVRKFLEEVYGLHDERTVSSIVDFGAPDGTDEYVTCMRALALAYYVLRNIPRAGLAPSVKEGTDRNATLIHVIKGACFTVLQMLGSAPFFLFPDSDHIKGVDNEYMEELMEKYHWRQCAVCKFGSIPQNKMSVVSETFPLKSMGKQLARTRKIIATDISMLRPVLWAEMWKKNAPITPSLDAVDLRKTKLCISCKTYIATIKQQNIEQRGIWRSPENTIEEMKRMMKTIYGSVSRAVRTSLKMVTRVQRGAMLWFETDAIPFTKSKTREFVIKDAEECIRRSLPGWSIPRVDAPIDEWIRVSSGLLRTADTMFRRGRGRCTKYSKMEVMQLLPTYEVSWIRTADAGIGEEMAAFLLDCWDSTQRVQAWKHHSSVERSFSIKRKVQKESAGPEKRARVVEQQGSCWEQLLRADLEELKNGAHNELLAKCRMEMAGSERWFDSIAQLMNLDAPLFLETFEEMLAISQFPQGLEYCANVKKVVQTALATHKTALQRGDITARLQELKRSMICANTLIYLPLAKTSIDAIAALMPTVRKLLGTIGQAEVFAGAEDIENDNETVMMLKGICKLKKVIPGDPKILLAVKTLLYDKLDNIIRHCKTQYDNVFICSRTNEIIAKNAPPMDVVRMLKRGDQPDFIDDVVHYVVAPSAYCDARAVAITEDDLKQQLLDDDRRVIVEYLFLPWILRYGNPATKVDACNKVFAAFVRINDNGGISRETMPCDAADPTLSPRAIIDRQLARLHKPEHVVTQGIANTVVNILEGVRDWDPLKVTCIMKMIYVTFKTTRAEQLGHLEKYRDLLRHIQEFRHIDDWRRVRWGGKNWVLKKCDDNLPRGTRVEHFRATGPADLAPMKKKMSTTAFRNMLLWMRENPGEFLFDMQAQRMICILSDKCHVVEEMASEVKKMLRDYEKIAAFPPSLCIDEAPMSNRVQCEELLAPPNVADVALLEIAFGEQSIEASLELCKKVGIVCPIRFVTAPTLKKLVPARMRNVFFLWGQTEFTSGTNALETLASMGKKDLSAKREYALLLLIFHKIGVFDLSQVAIRKDNVEKLLVRCIAGVIFVHMGPEHAGRFKSIEDEMARRDVLRSFCREIVDWIPIELSMFLWKGLTSEPSLSARAAIELLAMWIDRNDLGSEAVYESPDELSHDFIPQSRRGYRPLRSIVGASAAIRITINEDDEDRVLCKIASALLSNNSVRVQIGDGAEMNNYTVTRAMLNHLQHALTETGFFSMSAEGTFFIAGGEQVDSCGKLSAGGAMVKSIVDGTHERSGLYGQYEALKSGAGELTLSHLPHMVGGVVFGYMLSWIPLANNDVFSVPPSLIRDIFSDPMPGEWMLADLRCGNVGMKDLAERLEKMILGEAPTGSNLKYLRQLARVDEYTRMQMGVVRFAQQILANVRQMALRYGIEDALEKTMDQEVPLSDDGDKFYKIFVEAARVYAWNSVDVIWDASVSLRNAWTALKSRNFTPENFLVGKLPEMFNKVIMLREGENVQSIEAKIETEEMKGRYATVAEMLQKEYAGGDTVRVSAGECILIALYETSSGKHLAELINAVCSKKTIEHEILQINVGMGCDSFYSLGKIRTCSVAIDFPDLFSHADGEQHTLPFVCRHGAGCSLEALVDAVWAESVKKTFDEVEENWSAFWN